MLRGLFVFRVASTTCLISCYYSIRVLYTLVLLEIIDRPYISLSRNYLKKVY